MPSKPTSFRTPLTDPIAASVSLHFVAFVILTILPPMVPARNKVPDPIEVEILEEPKPVPEPLEPPKHPAAEEPPKPEPAIESKPSEAPADAVLIPEPRHETVVDPGLQFVRSDDLIAATDVESDYVSDQTARSLVEGRSRASLTEAAVPSPLGRMPRPKTGLDETADPRSEEKAALTKGEEGNDAPLQSEERSETGVPMAGLPPRITPEVRQEPVLASLAAPAEDPTAFEDPEGAEPDTSRETRTTEASAETLPVEEVLEEREEVETEQTSEIVADAHEDQPESEPEVGGQNGDGRTGGSTKPQPSLDGTPGIHTRPGSDGAPSQRQAAPQEVRLDVNAMLSVREHPLGPWLKLVDDTLRERWNPSPDLRARAQGTTEIGFVVSLNGRITGIELVTSSGRSELDAVALSAIPAKVPPPKPFTGTSLYLTYTFVTGP